MAKKITKEEIQIKKAKREVLMQTIIELSITIFFIISAVFLLVALVLMIKYKW